TPHAFTSPLRRHEQGDDIHRFTAELGAPLIGSVSVTAEHSFSIFGDDHEPAILGIHDVLKNPPRILARALGADVRQQLTGEVTQLVHVLGDGRSNLKRSYAHGVFTGSHRHIVISN